jgi:predicted TIM-barrel fold metal-dependent hydrolase
MLVDSVEPIPFPSARTKPQNSWRPPAGVRLISADDHNMEVENLYQDRLPASLKDKAPKYYRDAQGKWVFEAEGRSLLPKGTEGSSENMAGFWDLSQRVAHMDAEGIEASIVFHGRFQALNGLQDKPLYMACVDVYNEWLIEYLKPHSKRLHGVAILPTFHNPAASRDYMQKLKALGYKAVQIPAFPRGVRYNSRDMDPMWEAIQESGLPLSIHVGAYVEFVGNGSLGANLARNLGPYRPLLGQLIFSGMFDRYPNLRVIFTEGGFQWAGQALVDMDYIARTYGSLLRPKLAHLPSFYWKRNCAATFMYDPVGLKIIDDIGVDNVMWSTDYPHAEGTWGYSGEVAELVWNTLGAEKATKVLGATAARLWGI